MQQGKRGPGRTQKADDDKKKAHPVYATDDEWKTIVNSAKAAGKQASPYIIDKALERK